MIVYLLIGNEISSGSVVPEGAVAGDVCVHVKKYMQLLPRNVDYHPIRGPK